MILCLVASSCLVGVAVIEGISHILLLPLLSLMQRTLAVSSFSEAFTLNFSGVIQHPQEDPEMLWVMGPVLAVIVIIIIVIGILLFKR